VKKISKKIRNIVSFTLQEILEGREKEKRDTLINEE